jgi:acyl-coenzyme A synthetase/AMP-(fatty) acid ligase
MVPSKIIQMDDMPLNANGKVDRAALKTRLESDAVERARTDFKDA